MPQPSTTLDSDRSTTAALHQAAPGRPGSRLVQSPGLFLCLFVCLFAVFPVSQPPTPLHKDWSTTAPALHLADPAQGWCKAQGHLTTKPHLATIGRSSWIDRSPDWAHSEGDLNQTRSVDQTLLSSDHMSSHYQTPSCNHRQIISDQSFQEFIRLHTWLKAKKIARSDLAFKPESIKQNAPL